MFSSAGLARLPASGHMGSLRSYCTGGRPRFLPSAPPWEQGDSVPCTNKGDFLSLDGFMFRVDVCRWIFFLVYNFLRLDFTYEKTQKPSMNIC